MSSIHEVFTTTEVAKMLNITPSHVLRLAKSMSLSENEVCSAGKRNHLFSKETIKKTAKQKIKNKIGMA